MAGSLKNLSVAEQSLNDDDDISTYDRVVELINQAALRMKDKDKIADLLKVQELIVNKEPTLLDNFLDEMLAFQSGHSTDVKKFVIGFMEASCQRDPEILVKVVPNLNLLLHEDNVAIQKKALLGLPNLLVVALKWIALAKKVTDEMEQIWEALNQMKNMSMEMLESDNDGIRTHAVKCMEIIILALTEKTPESEIPTKGGLSFTIDQLSAKHKFLKFKKLSQNGQKTFDQLLHFQASAHISSINLMTAMSCLTNIAKQRPQFYAKVIQDFETLHVNLPPTLAKSQVSSVRKNLKMQMLQLLRHKSSIDHVSRITTLLTDLGATQTEISKAVPKYDEPRKRKTNAEISESSTKKAKVAEPELEVDEDEIGMTPWAKKENRPSARLRTTAIDITAEDIRDKLTPENVADLVLISMVMLPEAEPAQFASIYTPIAAAGTDEQIKHLARLLATQLTMAGMGKGIADILNTTKTVTGGATPYEDGSASPTELSISVVGATDTRSSKTTTLDIFKTPDLPMGQTGRRSIKQFKLSSVTHSFPKKESDLMVVAAFNRIIDAEKSKIAGKAIAARTKLLATLVAHCGSLLKTGLQDYIFDDINAHSDLAFSWLYQEYANSQGFNVVMPTSKNDLASYDECLTRLLNGLMTLNDNKEGLFSRLILEAPVITENAIQLIKKYCLIEENTRLGMVILEEVIMKRPKHRHAHLSVMLELTTNENHDIRNVALEFVRKIYKKESMKPMIEEYALTNLRYLLLPRPPEILFSSYKLKSDTWVDEIVKMCLSLYLGLLPHNHTFIHELALVYTAAIADIKRIILRVIENPVKGMGMQSPELLRFVETCPKGAETLVTRVIHVLTDKADPSPELVSRVKDLYQKRVPDVRFLIPVLTGLSKKEVIAALPKLIKLNPVVVKEVFHRLLSAHNEESLVTYTSPITPAELLFALHNIDPAKCDMKTTIKATNLCFLEPAIYTQEVLAIVIQQLMEQTAIATLFMRTVLQSLAMYPRLAGLVINVLHRLTKKKVWEDRKIWEGFIRCCQKTKPQSYAVLLQLPPPQLSSVFELTPELRQTLLEHVNSFTSLQRSHVPSAIMQTLEMNFPPGADPHLESEGGSSDINTISTVSSGDVVVPPGTDRDTTPVRDEQMSDQTTSDESHRKSRNNDEKTSPSSRTRSRKRSKTPSPPRKRERQASEEERNKSPASADRGRTKSKRERSRSLSPTRRRSTRSIKK